MSCGKTSLLNITDYNEKEIKSCFQRAKLFKQSFLATGQIKSLLPSQALTDKIVALVFFEPSTRTRLSFQMAAQRLGASTIVMDSMASSSLVKGETYEDTLRNISAMRPDLIVVRYNESPELDLYLPELDIPVVNGGAGTQGHPTQALLDAFTMEENLGSLANQRVLFVGDVLHSRVANSNLALLKKFGAQVAICSPPDWVRNEGSWSQVQNFSDLNEALSWCTVCMGLRIQKERHAKNENGFDLAAYTSAFMINEERLKALAKQALLLHPGPFLPNVDLSLSVLKDPRCKIFEQVTNGVFVRAALITQLLGVPVKGEE